MSSFFKLLFWLIALSISNQASAQKCLYISSYHQGYAWSDGVERGLRQELKGKCELKQFNMDTKRIKTIEYKQQIALKAKALIESWKPDVVIASDDNAAKYLIKPYYKNHTIPFVFCGINWNTDAYGFPYDNVTGMVEVAPIAELLDRAITITGHSNKAYYIGADTLSEQKNLQRYEQEAKNLNITLHHGLAKTNDEWIALYQKAQDYDFIIIGSYSGINNWKSSNIRSNIKQHAQKLTITIHDWMMPYSMYGLTKIPEEQGQWAAQVALYILQGGSPKDIPVVANRKWEVWVNQDIINRASIHIPDKLLKKAKTYID